MMNDPNISVVFHPSPQLNVNFDQESWQRADRLIINKNWRGDQVPEQLHTSARLLWSDDEIIFGFECGYTELDIDEVFNRDEERHALWDRDVCEAFVRSPIEPHGKRYREFEVAPTGQWCDLIVDRSEMWHDWEWKSGMRVAHEINKSEKVWRAAMAIPFDAFGCKPEIGDIWKANLYRISRYKGERQYLTLSPTLTEEPNFHVAESFVNLCFVE
jgi:hypothetical protein